MEWLTDSADETFSFAYLHQCMSWMTEGLEGNLIVVCLFFFSFYKIFSGILGGPLTIFCDLHPLPCRIIGPFSIINFHFDFVKEFKSAHLTKIVCIRLHNCFYQIMETIKVSKTLLFSFIFLKKNVDFFLGTFKDLAVILEHRDCNFSYLRYLLCVCRQSLSYVTSPNTIHLI